jgi:NAD(P)-dependent dehydrogenase (short-subunit alcohol dehydrogenase family)
MGTVVVTGANRGIGLELVRIFHARGETVVAGCRTSSPELDALGVRVESLDVSDDASVAAFAARVQGPVDVLVNNAGLLSRETLQDLSSDRIRRQFEVNAMGPLRVSGALAPKLRKGSKVAIITSRMGSIADNTSGGMYGYRMSKAAVNAAGKSLAMDLAPSGVSVALLHPGYVRTGMTGGTGHVGPDEAASDLVARIDGMTAENTGSFWHANGEQLPW